MARNGSGTYNLPAGNPVVTGTSISSTWANNTLGDMATALTGSIASDGQTTPSANLPMGNYAHTNVANATVRNMYAAAGQVQDNVFQYLNSVSGVDTITATAAYGMSAYVTGQQFTFVSAGSNTGAATLNINSIGAKAITKNGTTALSAGDIASGMVVTVTYDGTRFQLTSVAPAATVSSFSAGTTGLTPSTASTGAITLAGTLNVANGGTGSTSLTSNSVLLGNGTSALSGNMVAPSTTGNVLTSNGTTWTSSPNKIYTGTAVATTSGTAVDITGIPSWVKKITVSFYNNSWNASSVGLLQVGTSGGIVSTGYTNNGAEITSSPNGFSSTAGIPIAATANAADVIYGGIAILTNISGNIWIYSVEAASGNSRYMNAGNISLGGTLDRVRFTSTVANTFDLGSFNIQYE